MSEPMHTASETVLTLGHLSHTVTARGVTRPLAEVLADFMDGPDKVAMQAALALHPDAISIECRYRPDGTAPRVLVGLGDPREPTTVAIYPTEAQADDMLELTQAQHLSAIEVAARNLENDDRASAATKALLLALAAYATSEMRVRTQQADGWASHPPS